jgi:DNA repair exonuclease SbcCD ATPase subunit
MSNEQYRKAYETAAAELEAALKQQEKLEERILSLRKTMNVLSTLLQQAGEEMDHRDRAFARVEQIMQTSLTDDIFKIVSLAPEALTTKDIREELNKLGGSVAEHSNPLATINAVANRLAEHGRIKETVKDGRKAWERKTVQLSSLLGATRKDKK